MDLKLTDYDLDITNGELSFVTSRDAVAQDLTMAWRTFLGETVYDVTVGVPYTQVIFANRNPNLDVVRFILQQIGERRPQVNSILLTPILDSVTRELTAEGTADTEEGEIDLTKLFGGNGLKCTGQNPLEVGAAGVGTTAQSMLLEMTLFGVGVDG